MRKRSVLAVLFAAVVAVGEASVTASCGTSYGDAGTTADASNADAIAANDAGSDGSPSTTNGDSQPDALDTGADTSFAPCRVLFTDDFEGSKIDDSSWTQNVVEMGALDLVVTQNSQALECTTSGDKDKAYLAHPLPVVDLTVACPFRVTFLANISGGSLVTLFEMALSSPNMIDPSSTIALTYATGHLALQAFNPDMKPKEVPIAEGAFHAISIQYNPANGNATLWVDGLQSDIARATPSLVPSGFLVGIIVATGVSTVVIDNVTAQ